MTTQSLITIGAAMPINALAQHRDWLLTHQRDLELQDPVSPEVLDGDWRPRVRQARSLLDGYTGRLGIHGPSFDITLSASDPKIRAIVVERLLQGLEIAAALGATHMVLHSPFHFFGDTLVVHTGDNTREHVISAVHALLEPVLPVAQQANCTLMIETIYDRNPAPLLALVRSFDSPHVRLSIDTGHTLVAQHLGGPPPHHWVTAAGSLLGHVHVQDGDGYVDRHWVPGEGSINWRAFFGAIATLEQPPRLVLELRDPAQLRRAAGWLQEQGLAQ